MSQQQSAFPRIRYLAVLCHAMLLMGGLGSFSGAQAQTGDSKDQGTLFVQGTLTESPCNLEMASPWQLISLEGINTAQLQHPGDRATPIDVNMTLRNCQQHTRSHNQSTGSAGQPVVDLTFTSSSTDTPSRMHLRGVPLALRVRDPRGQSAGEGSRLAPLAESGQRTLVYSVTPERIRAEAGQYQDQMQINFRLSYD